MDIEQTIAESYVERDLVDELRAKVRLIVLQEQGVSGASIELIDTTYRHLIIPRLLTRVFDFLLYQYVPMAVQDHGDPVIDFKKLKRHVNAQTKKFAADLF